MVVKSETAMENEELNRTAELAISGDRQALAQLIRMFHPRIYQMVFHRIQHQSDAEDLTQEIFIKMCEQIHRLNHPEAFKSWLFRMALNKVRDYMRKKTIIGFFGSGTDMDGFADSRTVTSSVETDIQKKQFFQQVHRFMEKLSKWEKEVFLLRFIDQLEIHEIADTLKKNPNTVKTHLYRAIKKFKSNSDLRILVKGVIP